MTRKSLDVGNSSLLVDEGDLREIKNEEGEYLGLFPAIGVRLWLDGKEGFTMEIVRLVLCLALGVYAYIEMSIAAVAVSLMIYSILNILALPWINRPQVIPEALKTN